jgi:hypothetical protein
MLLVAIPDQFYGDKVGVSKTLLVVIPDQAYGYIVAVSKTCYWLPYLISFMGI